MTMLMNNTNRAEIAVYYSAIRKAEMKMYGEKSCSALLTLVKDIISRHDGIIEKIIVPTDSDRQVDFIITVKTSTPKELDELTEELYLIKSGVSKISVFPLAIC